jgi:hypothetical protein
MRWCPCSEWLGIWKCGGKSCVLYPPCSNKENEPKNHTFPSRASRPRKKKRGVVHVRASEWKINKKRLPGKISWKWRVLDILYAVPKRKGKQTNGAPRKPSCSKPCRLIQSTPIRKCALFPIPCFRGTNKYRPFSTPTPVRYVPNRESASASSPLHCYGVADWLPCLTVN